MVISVCDWCFCLSGHIVPQSGSWSPPWPEARRTAGFAGHRCHRLQTHLRTSSTLLHQGMTREERGGSTWLTIIKHKNKDVMWWFRLSRQVIHWKDTEHSVIPSQVCADPELFLCVRTTNPIIACNYNPVKPKIELRQASILIFVGFWHGQRTHHHTGYHLWHKVAAPLRDTDMSCATQSLLVTPRTENNAEAKDLGDACVFV